MKNNSRIETISLLLLVLFFLLLSACGSPPKPLEQAPPKEIDQAAQPAPQPEPEYAEAAPQSLPETSPIKPDLPDRYVVKKGDTLWDIASRFLHDPWRWPEVWHINPKIRNPHLIYPGDVIALYYVDGKPFLTLEGAGTTAPPPPKVRDLPTTKLEPRARYSPIEKAIDTIPRSHIGPFLTRPIVVSDSVLEKAPYIVSTYENHLVTGTGNRIYARGEFDGKTGAYYIVRFGETLRDPETDEIIGRNLKYVGMANLLRTGDPSTLRVTRAELEIIVGDLLLPVGEEKQALNFLPRAPSKLIDGQIVAVVNGLTQIGQFNVVILNRGERDGLEAGHVLAIFQGGKRERDIFKNEYYITPDERAGLLMVFKTYDKISYALVMEAYRALEVLDMVKNP